MAEISTFQSAPGRTEFRGSTAAILGVLTVIVALLPFFSHSYLTVIAVRHLMALALILAIWQDAERRTIPILVTIVAVLDIVFQWSPLEGTRFALTERLLALSFVLATAGYLVRRLWTVEGVGFSALIVAIAVYFLLGLTWAAVFSVTEMLAPGSFANVCLSGSEGASACVPEIGQFPRLTYFSFVTLTTLGFGDVVPLTSKAEGVSIMAAVSGQLFMAVLVGRLVGSYLSASTRKVAALQGERRADSAQIHRDESEVVT